MSRATLVHVLRERAVLHGDDVLYRLLVDGDVDGAVEERTFAEADRRARTVGSWLRREVGAGERALLLFDQDLHFLDAFLGCLDAGVIAVPTSTPDPTRLALTIQRLVHVVRDSGAGTVLTTRAIERLAGALATGVPALSGLRWVAIDGIDGDVKEAGHPAPTPDDIAFLQYTSGSTGDPRGVIVTHAGLMANQRQIAASVDRPVRSVVSWLPMFHDMGLIGAALHPIYSGGSCTFLAPLAFLQRPMAWLRAISHYQADTSASPNFGYDLVVRKLKPAELDALDLSSWTTALSGAEPVHSETIERFTRAFAACGFRPEAMFPAYGLAEATLLVTGARRGEPPRRMRVDADAFARGAVVAGETGEERVVVTCGPAAPDVRIAIVDPESRRELGDGAVGEIWLQTAGAARGYWRQRRQTAATFEAHTAQGDGPFLRTGDLGFVHDGELFVTGRLKDTIIVRGANHYPHDIEEVVARSHARIRTGCVAAFGVDLGDEEGVVVVAEVDMRGDPPDLDAMRAEVRREVLVTSRLRLHEVVFIAAKTVPKTSSGKLRRGVARELWRTNALSVLTPPSQLETA